MIFSSDWRHSIVDTGLPCFEEINGEAIWLWPSSRTDCSFTEQYLRGLIDDARGLIDDGGGLIGDGCLSIDYWALHPATGLCTQLLGFAPSY